MESQISNAVLLLVMSGQLAGIIKLTLGYFLSYTFYLVLWISLILLLMAVEFALVVIGLLAFGAYRLIRSKKSGTASGPS